MTFGDRLKKLREKRGWTQQDLANKLEVSRPAIANYESNRKIPREETLVSIAKLFNTTTDFLLGSTDNPSPPDRNTDLKDAEPGQLTFGGVPLNEEQLKLVNDFLGMIIRDRLPEWEKEQERKRQEEKD